MTTNDLIVLSCIYGIPFALHVWATIATRRAVESTREMDAHDNAPERYEAIRREIDAMIRRTP